MQKLTKLCFVILICFTNQLFSQNINTTIPNAVNTVFQNLDKTKIPHNILLDYGYDFIDVTAYNGQLNTNNYLSISKHKSLYNALVSAVTATGVNGIEQPIQEYTEWENLQKQYSKEGTITNSANVILAGLFFDYSKINELALSNNKITVANNKYYDKYINGIWQNPYESKMAFAITAPVLTLNRGLVKVKLPQTLWHTNKQIRNISIYMGSGRPVYQNLNNEAVAYFDYQTTGTYTWTYRVEYAGGTFAYAHQKVIIKSLEGSSNYISRNANCGNLDIVNIIATKPYLNQLGTATLQIAYGSDDCKIRKPLIVAEGFDTGLLAQAGSIGDSDYENFKNSLFDSNSTNLKNLTINDTTEDYDIIYVNWDNGTDYLQRNAYVLEAVIKYVNEQKTINGSTTQNVVLGQSMGGVIARYALKDMENDNTLNHDTRLYISHDAPHKGAHIPIGLLYMARHIVREFIQTPLNQTIVPLITDGDLGLGTISALLGQPALQQMLINNVNVSGQKDNTVHNAWQNELQQMGYPSLTRNIALSNGSHCASTFGLVSNQTLLDINGEIKSTGIAELLLPFLGLSSLPGLALGDLEIILLGNLPGSTKLDIDFKVRTFANYGTGEVYHGDVSYEKKLLWVLPITKTVTSKTVTITTNYFFDNYPGGNNPSTSILENFNQVKDFFLASYNLNLNVTNSNINFISVASALDVTRVSGSLTPLDFLDSYNSSNPPTGNLFIPFDNFTTSKNTFNTNETHISFNRLNGDWLATELDNTLSNEDYFDCTAFCDTTPIFGGDFLCDLGTYSVSNLATTVNWTITDPNGLVSFTTNGNEITITQSNQYQSGFITINVFMYSSKCGTANKSLQVWVGNPKPTNFQIHGGHDNVGTTSSSQLNVSPVSGATEYYWNIYVQNSSCPNNGVSPKFQTSNGYESTLTSSSVYAFINWGTCPGTYVVNCYAVNDCGSQGISHKIVEVYGPNDDNPCPDGPTEPINGNNSRNNSLKDLIIYPNPSENNSSVQMRIPDPGNPCDDPSGFKNANSNKNIVSLYDFSGRKLFTREYKNYVIEIDNSTLKKGNYIIEVINTKGQIFKKQLVVE